MSGEILVVQNFTDYGRPMSLINQPLFLKKAFLSKSQIFICDFDLNLGIKELGI